MPSQLLPAEAYTSNEWFAREQRTLFADCWTYACPADRLRETGDYVTLTSGTQPLAVIRDAEGRLRGFHNLCRHRGTELLEGAGNAGKTLVCPYHRWTYGLDGRLRGVPDKSECFPELDRGALGLNPATIGEWKGMVFINPNPEADFTSYIQGVGRNSFPHDITESKLVPGDELVYLMQCNWKVFFENAIDGYHLAYLHENTLGGPVPGANEWETHGDNMVWYSTERDGIRNRIPKFVEDHAGGATKIKGAEDPGYGGVYMLFPTTIITPSPWSLTISRLEPVAADKTILRARTWTPDSWFAAKEKLSDVPGYSAETGLIESKNWTQHPLETGDFQTEDIWICEKIQRGLASTTHSTGPLAGGTGGEAMLPVFQASVLRMMDGH